MGNHLAGIAPSQIFPVETYLSDLPNIHYEASLGSTRFLKVAKCKTREGLVVVKVFVIHDPTLQLSAYKKKIEDVSTKLITAANCLQFQYLKATEKAGLMIRQYVKSNLYDRISTRPFLTSIEKKWIAFQILYALKQAHQQGICHGDIKLENVMVSSWNWLLLADFATIKPTTLPENDPADFTYFFDTSRRRTCYLAPERFFGTSQSESQHAMIDTKDKDILTPAMDVFSVGCCLAELFTEGHAPFDLTQLLAYRVGDYHPTKVLDKIDDPRVKALVEHMIQREPGSRYSVDQYLDQERGLTFPEHFYTFLWPFLKQFAVTPIMPHDDKMKQIKNSLGDILVALEAEDKDSMREQETLEPEKKDKEKPEKKCEALIIIASLITSSLRALRFTSSKLDALELLGKVSEYVPDEIILDRILPYIFHLLHDGEPRVRVFAIHTLTHCLALVSSVPRSDANIFLEYILPNLADITQDETTIVRQAYAENIATIAETALRFLEYSQLQGMITSYSYETELATLQEVIVHKVATMFSDPSNVVKRTLMEKAVTKLCVFFGKQKANDVLLSHMITFLNDKHDRHLRLSFFTSIVGVAAYIGCHCADILKPLLLQGLSDAEESVVVAAIEAMTSLTELGLFPTHLQCDLLTHTAPLLIHPNLWIRQAVVGLVCVIAGLLPLVNVQTAVVARVQPFLVKPLLQLDREVCILSCLRPPVSREVFDAIVKSADVSQILSLLQEAQQKKIPLAKLPSSLSHIDHPTRNLLRRLVGGGLTEENIEQLIKMQDHLVRLQRQKKATEATRNSSHQHQQHLGLVNIEDLKKSVPTHHCRLLPEDGRIDGSTLYSPHRGLIQSPGMAMNEEWQAMFGTTEDHTSSNRATENRSVSPVDPEATPKTAATTNSKPGSEGDKKGNIKCTSTCKKELENLVAIKREEHLECVKKRRALDTLAWDMRLPPPGWRPRGHLMAHLHEHRGAVNRLVPIGDTSIYASCSSDGTVKIWDCYRIERKFSINRSKVTYTRQGGSITSITPCITNESLASASSNGSIHVIKLEKMTLINSRQLNTEEDSYVVDMHFFDTGSQSVLTYATVFGSIVGWDLRAPGTAWKLENGPRKGVITSYALEGTQSWLVAGTSSGHHVCWDLRFMLPISTITHPRGGGVRRVNMHPKEGSWVVSAVNGNNEISMWDMETHSRHMTLWASPKPPLSMTQPFNNSVCGMYVAQGDRGAYVLAGGTDATLRYWDLCEPESSYIVCHAANDHHLQGSTSYSARVVDGTEVIVETISKPRSSPSTGDDIPRRGPDQPPPGHKDIITDVTVMNEPQRLVITSARDGTIKMWK